MSLFLFFKQKTAYEMRISYWSSDVCSSDLFGLVVRQQEFQSHIRDDADNNGDHGNLPALRHGNPKQFFRCLMMSRTIVSSFAAAISRERLWYFALAVAPRGPQMHDPTGHWRSTIGRRPAGVNGV